MVEGVIVKTVLPDDLKNLMRSKKDLYNVFTIDGKLLLLKL
jgi:hypothetical protein